MNLSDPRTRTTPVAQFGDLNVEKYETSTGARLRLSIGTGQQVDIDPLELEALTRARHTPSPLLASSPTLPPEPEEDEEPEFQTRLQLLQNEFTLVGVARTNQDGQDGLVIREMNGGQAVHLTPDELRGLLRARHADFAPLVDTSGLEAAEEPDIDQV